jgi:hypothetical protein
MRVYNGSAWQDTAISPNSPTFTGTVTADGLTVNSNDSQNVLLRDDNSFSGADNQIKLAIAPSISVGNSAGIAFGTFSADDYWKQGIFWERVGNFGVGDLIIANRENADTVTVTDADQRIRIASNGDISFYEDTGTTPKFFWDASAESLGIGNAVPQYQLDLNTTGSNTLFGAGISASTASGPLNLSLSSWGQSGGRSGIITFTTGSATNGSERMRIDASGNVGIGTTSPAAFTGFTANRKTLQIVNTTSGNGQLRLGTAAGLMIDHNGGGTTTSTIRNLYGATNAAASLALQSGIITLGTGTSYTERMRIDSSGNVGIGTSSPTEKLDVTGTVKATSYTETVYALSGTALDPANGGIQTKTLAANTTFTDSLASGESLVLQLEAGASYTVTWPTMTWVTSGGNVAPTLTAKDTLVFWKVSSVLYGAYTGSYV